MSPDEGAFSKEFVEHNILVNALCTGWFVTEQWETRWQAEAPNSTFEEHTASRGKQVSLGRMGKPEISAKLACLLASDTGGYIQWHGDKPWWWSSPSGVALG